MSKNDSNKLSQHLNTAHFKATLFIDTHLRRLIKWKWRFTSLRQFIGLEYVRIYHFNSIFWHFYIIMVPKSSLKIIFMLQKSKNDTEWFNFWSFYNFEILFNFFILKSCSSKRVKVLKDNNWTIVWIFFIILWFQAWNFGICRLHFCLRICLSRKACFWVEMFDLILMSFLGQNGRFTKLTLFCLQLETMAFPKTSPTQLPTQLERKIKFDLILVQIGSFFLGQKLESFKRDMLW